MKHVFILACVCISWFSAKAQHEYLDKLKTIDFLTGEWKVYNEMRLARFGPWDTSEGRSVIARTLKETMIEENYTGSKQGKPFLARTFFAVNNVNMKFQRTFADSEHGVMVEFEGDRSNDSLIFDREWRNPAGIVIKLRTVYKIISKDQFIEESMRLPPGETQWDVTGRKKYTRIK